MFKNAHKTPLICERVCVCVCVWVLWACNVRLTPKAKQLNVEIQEIQVNIKRKNYVNQKVKATRQWREGTTARRGAALARGSTGNWEHEQISKL